MSKLFYQCSSLISLPDISKWHVNNITNMGYLFYGCSSLISLPDISKWDVKNETNICDLFSGCSSLIFLPDISKWNVNNITNINGLFSECSLIKRYIIKKPNIIKESMQTNETDENVLENLFFLNENQKEEKFEKNLKEFGTNNIIDCEGNYSFDYFKEEQNEMVDVKNFDNNFDNCNYESSNLGINFDNNYFVFRFNMPENSKLNKDSDYTINTLNIEKDKDEIKNNEFLFTTTKEKKDNLIYNQIFTESCESLNKEQLKELIDNNNLINYIIFTKKKKSKLKKINNLNNFEQFYGKSKEFESLILNTNVPNVEIYNFIYNSFYRSYVIGSLIKKYIKVKKLLFFQKKKLFKIFNYFLEIIKKIERLKFILFK